MDAFAEQALPVRARLPAPALVPSGLSLVEIIELKWLAAGVGLAVHVERMQDDAAYAADTLDRAAAAGQGTLARVARRLRAAVPACDAAGSPSGGR